MQFIHEQQIIPKDHGAHTKQQRFQADCPHLMCFVRHEGHLLDMTHLQMGKRHYRHTHNTRDHTHGRLLSHYFAIEFVQFFLPVSPQYEADCSSDCSPPHAALRRVKLRPCGAEGFHCRRLMLRWPRPC